MSEGKSTVLEKAGVVSTLLSLPGILGVCAWDVAHLPKVGATGSLSDFYWLLGNDIACPSADKELCPSPIDAGDQGDASQSKIEMSTLKKTIIGNLGDITVSSHQRTDTSFVLPLTEPNLLFFMKNVSTGAERKPYFDIGPIVGFTSVRVQIGFNSDDPSVRTQFGSYTYASPTSGDVFADDQKEISEWVGRFNPMISLIGFYPVGLIFWSNRTSIVLGYGTVRNSSEPTLLN